MIAACSVDWLGRSLQDPLRFLEEIRRSGVISTFKQVVDTTPPADRALFQMRVFAEFERSMIRFVCNGSEFDDQV
jgi:DNA invertase Pin-like site-specific DNA recombinase